MSTSPLLGDLYSESDQGPYQGLPLEPVVITLTSDHLFELKKPTKHVCVRCGEHRLHPNHGPFSFNIFGSGADRWTYQKTKKSWHEAWSDRTSGLVLPRPCRTIEVFGRISFEGPPPGREKRDEENYRYPLSKFLADSLQKCGFLKNDDWASFRFRELELIPDTPGIRRVELMIVATA